MDNGSWWRAKVVDRWVGVGRDFLFKIITCIFKLIRSCRCTSGISPRHSQGEDSNPRCQKWTDIIQRHFWLLLQTCKEGRGMILWHGAWSRQRTNCFLQVRSLYKGMSSPLIGVAGINAITFGAYGNVLRMLPHPESIASISLAGSAAGLIQVVMKTCRHDTKLLWRHVHMIHSAAF